MKDHTHSSFKMYRLFETESGERKATARSCKDGTIFQVYPVKQTFESIDEWRAAWPDLPILKEQEIKSSAKRDPFNGYRLQRDVDLMQFFRPENKEFFTEVYIVKDAERGEPVLSLRLHDGSHWMIYRPLDFLKAPAVVKNGEPFGKTYELQSYSPALSTFKWFLMLAFVTPEIQC